jgi:hypothetical protein
MPWELKAILICLFGALACTFMDVWLPRKVQLRMASAWLVMGFVVASYWVVS